MRSSRYQSRVGARCRGWRCGYYRLLPLLLRQRFGLQQRSQPRRTPLWQRDQVRVKELDELLVQQPELGTSVSAVPVARTAELVGGALAPGGTEMKAYSSKIEVRLQP